MSIKDYTTEELRAEIKRRNELAKEAKMQEPRCRTCKHIINTPTWTKLYVCGVRTYGKTYKNNYRVNLWTKACDKYEKKIE